MPLFSAEFCTLADSLIITKNSWTSPSFVFFISFFFYSCMYLLIEPGDVNYILSVSATGSEEEKCELRDINSKLQEEKYL